MNREKREVNNLIHNVDPEFVFKGLPHEKPLSSIALDLGIENGEWVLAVDSGDPVTRPNGLPHTNNGKKLDQSPR